VIHWKRSGLFWCFFEEESRQQALRNAE